MAGRARGIGTHGQRPTEKAGNRGASNYCIARPRLASLDITTESRVASRLLYMRGIDRLQHLHDDGQFPEAAATDYDLQICCKKD